MADGESTGERLDRELMELLQELRVMLPGVQVLLAFLLTAPFQQRFAQLPGSLRNAFFASIACATLATATRWATRARTSQSVQSVGRVQSSSPRVRSSSRVAWPSAWATVWAWSGSGWGRRVAGVRESIIGLAHLEDARVRGVIADEQVQDGGREPGEVARGGRGGRPIAAPLERCAELLSVDLATVCELAAKVEPYSAPTGQGSGA
jgi:hypothetical protein